MPGSATSDVYCASPVTLARPSSRARRLADDVEARVHRPRLGLGLGDRAQLRGHRAAGDADPRAARLAAPPGCRSVRVSSVQPLARLSRRGHHRGEHLRVRPAAAQVAGHRVADRRADPAWRSLASSAAQLITMPGVQNPHCIASCSMNACWTGCSVAPFARPSIVVTGALADLERERGARERRLRRRGARCTHRTRRDRSRPWCRAARARRAARAPASCAARPSACAACRSRSSRSAPAPVR